MRNVKETVEEIKSLVAEAEFVIARLQALAVELERQTGNDDDEVLSDVSFDDSSSASSNTPNPVQRRREELQRQRTAARVRARNWYKAEKKCKERAQRRR